MQTLPAISSQLDQQQLSHSGQKQPESSGLQELSPSAADSRSNNSSRHIHPAAHRLPTPATAPDMNFLFPLETSQAWTVSNCGKPSDTAVWDSQQHLARHLRSKDCAAHNEPLTVQKCRLWWPEFNAHTAHPVPKASDWLHYGEHGHVQNANKQSVAAEYAAQTLADGHDAQSDPSEPSNSGLPDWMQDVLNSHANLSSTSSFAPSQAELDLSQAGVLVTSSTFSKHSQPRQQAVFDFDLNSSGHSAEASRLPAIDQAAPSSAASLHGQDVVLFGGEDCPKDPAVALEDLIKIFQDLPPNVVENALRQADYNESAASNKCLDLMNMKHGPVSGSWSDSGSPSDADSGSVAAEAYCDAASPRHLEGTPQEWLDPSESLQELDFEAKVAKLQQDFPDMEAVQLEAYLSAAVGSYDTAYAHLIHDVEERRDEQERLEQQALEDRKFALQLANEDSAQPVEPKVTEHHPNELAQDFEVDIVLGEWNAKDPNFQAKLQILTDRFPTTDKPYLVNCLAAAAGKVEDIVQMLESSSKGLTTEASQQPTAAPGNSSAASSNAAGSTAVGRAVVGASPVYDAGRPISPPPGFSTLRTQAPKPIQATRRSVKPDIYRDARLKFREAQEHIVQCHRDFHAAARCNDTQAQKRLSSQLAYWQNVAKEEKLRASKKIFTSKNAEVTNTYKLDLHALHVDEAIDKIQETRRDLRKFPCTWQVEAVTGKGLHSVGNEPKLLPAVKHFLDREGIQWWAGNPGMVVFQLDPKPEES